MAWRGSRARGAFPAAACIAFSRQRHRLRSPVAPVRQALVRADLADHIRREIEASDFHGEGYRKIWARLRVAGVRSSPRRMGENRLLAPHRVGRSQEKHDGTIVTDKVNEIWGTDMSQTVTLEEGRAYVFVAVEHANSEIIGIHAARSANRFEALEPVRQGVHPRRRVRERRRAGREAKKKH
jgi:putative transposase